MVRLPTPGGDEGTWGDILNQYLLKSHNSDGTLKGGTVSTSTVVDGSISEVKLDAAVRTKLNAGGSGPASTDDLPEGTTNLYFTSARAKTAAPVQSVNGKTGSISLTPADVGAATAAQGIKADSAVQPADLAAVATSGDYADLINQPTIPTVSDATTTSKGVIQLAGDLSGTAASPTVPGLATLNTSKIDKSEKGQPGGVAQLDSSGKLVPGQLVTSNITKVLPYSYSGPLAVNIGSFRLYNDSASSWTISGIRASVGVAPAGAAVIIDVSKNGTTVFTTQANRPTIAAGTNTSGNVTNMDVTTVAAGEYLTVDIDQIGSTTAGTDLTVQIEVY